MGELIVTAQSPLLTVPIGRTLIRLAAPNVVAMSVTLLAAVAEAWYVGRLGTVSLAGLALAFPMMMMMLMLSAGSIGGAITGSIAQRLGAGDRTGAEVLALNAIILAALLSVLSSLIFLGLGTLIYGGLGGSGDVLREALAYSDALFIGCFTMWLADALAGIVRAAGNMKVASKNLVLGSAIHATAAGLLVFGIGPLPELGIAGAAVGIVIGYGVAAILLGHFLLTKCDSLRLRFAVTSIGLVPMLRILKVGALSSINVLTSVLTVITITAFMARFGVDVLAGYGIGARLEFLLIPLIFGFGTASTVMVGVHFGANAIDRAHRIGWTAALYAACLTGVIGVTVAVFPGLWTNLFTNAGAVRAASHSYLEIAGPFYALFGLALCLYFASQGAGRVLWPVIASVVRFLIVLVGCLILAENPAATIAHFFILIAAGFVAQGILTGAAIQLGAWRHHLDGQSA